MNHFLSAFNPVIGATQQSSVSEHASFIILGFLFVVVVLAALAFITSVIGVGFRKLTQAPPPNAGTPPPIAEAPTTEETSPFQDHEIPEHIPVLIAAAAHAALSGKPHRIVSIRGASQGWAQEGRREIFKSHSFR